MVRLLTESDKDLQSLAAETIGNQDESELLIILFEICFSPCRQI